MRILAFLPRVISIACVGIFIGTVFFHGSYVEYLDEKYDRVDNFAVTGERPETITFEAPGQPSDVTRDLTRHWSPVSTNEQPVGNFIRYKDTIVAVVPNYRGGSFITVDEAQQGYERWFTYVGDQWGTAKSGNDR